MGLDSAPASAPVDPSLFTRLARSPLAWRVTLAGSILALLAFGIVGIRRSASFNERGPDLGYFYVAGKCLLHGQSPYDPVSFGTENHGFGDVRNEGYFYPPQFGALCVALAVLPYIGAKIVLLVLNVLFLLLLVRVCAEPPKTPWDPGVPDPAPEARWLIPAIILGNPFTSHVLWMGQTTLIAIASIAGGWVLAHRGRTVPAGLLIGISTIKPQYALIPCLWLLLEGRWKVLLTGVATALILSVPVMIVAGPVGGFVQWTGALGRYDRIEFNAVGFPHLFSAQNFLASMGIPAPSLAPLGVVAAAALWVLRSRVVPADLLAFLVAIPLVSGYSHDYDLAALALVVPVFWRHLRGREGPAILAIVLMLILFIPQRLFEPLGNRLLLQFRYPLVLGLLGWLLALSVAQAAVPAGQRPAVVSDGSAAT
jgi:hypothetical protein